MNLFFLLLILFTNPSEKINIVDPWMRVGAQGQATALFMKIENNGEVADTLYQVDFDLAGKVEIHETYEKEGMMGMREVGMIVIPPKSTFELKPRAHHVMLMKLKQDIRKGYEGEFTLYFKVNGKLNIKAKAQEMPMMKMDH